MPSTLTLNSDQLAELLAPSPGSARMPCGESVTEAGDGIALHEQECTECQREIHGVVLTPAI